MLNNNNNNNNNNKHLLIKSLIMRNYRCSNLWHDKGLYFNISYTTLKIKSFTNDDVSYYKNLSNINNISDIQEFIKNLK